MKNKRNSRLLFLILITFWLLLNLSGGVIVKYAGNCHKDLVLLGILLALLFATFGGRAVVSMLIGKRYQLSYAYPFLGLNYVFSLFAGWLLFQEKITLPRITGSIVILAGVCLLMFSGNKEDQERS